MGGTAPRLTLGGHGEGVRSVSHAGHDSHGVGGHPGSHLAPCRNKRSPRVRDLGGRGL